MGPAQSEPASQSHFISGSHTIMFWETSEDLRRRLALHLEGARRAGQQIQAFSPDPEKLRRLVESEGVLGASFFGMDELQKRVSGLDLKVVIRNGVQESWKVGNSGLFVVVQHEEETVNRLGLGKILRKEKELDRNGYVGFTSLCIFPGTLMLADDVTPHYASLIGSHTHADFPGYLISMT